MEDHEAELQGQGDKVAHIEYTKRLAELQRQGKGDKVGYINRKLAELAAFLIKKKLAGDTDNNKKYRTLDLATI